MNFALVGLAFLLIVVSIDASADPKVCVLCKHMIAKVIEEYPVINAKDVDMIVDSLHKNCATPIFTGPGLKDLCIEAVDVLAVPIIHEAGHEGKWDPSQCSVIQVC